MPPYSSLVFSDEFLRSLLAARFSAAEIAQLFRALRLLDQHERHPSLRVHQLQGDLAGQWSASASSSLRITFVRLDDGRKAQLAASRHYGD
jgi:mRNA-degrading endonuclease YafQ of YafQ-DinJ toxin-antitoxin module